MTKRITKEKKIQLFQLLLKSRRVEEQLIELFQGGGIPGWVHSAIGEEAIGVAFGVDLKKDDYIVQTHRDRSAYIAKGIDLKPFMAECMGKSTGFCKGKAGEIHMIDMSIGLLGMLGTVGAGYPMANGAAFSAKYRGTDQVAICLFGDGSVDQGTFHESMNLASLWKLPVVFICENNGWAQFTPQTATASVLDVYKKAAAYNMPGELVDGDDMLAVYKVAQEAIDRARNGEGPTLVECKTHRWYGHFIGDPQKYRDPKEVEDCRNYDPLARYQTKILEENVLTIEDIEKMEQDIKAEIEDVVRFAQESPQPDPEEALKDVYYVGGHE